MPPVTLWVALVLVAIHALLMVAGSGFAEEAWIRLAFVPADLARSFGDEGSIRLGILATLISHMLLHANWTHVMMNVGFLLAFGSLVERALGPWRTLFFLLICGVIGALTLFAAGPFDEVLVIGASGAVYGTAGAATRLFFLPRSGTRGAVIFVSAMMSLNLLFGLVDFGLVSDGSSLAWEAHAGSFVAGLALIYVLPLRRRRYRALV
ncbi:MAG: rhomboid family intramembrane serine protease [Alphaproteobacteria bacterium]